MSEIVGYLYRIDEQIYMKESEISELDSNTIVSSQPLSDNPEEDIYSEVEGEDDVDDNDGE